MKVWVYLIFPVKMSDRNHPYFNQQIRIKLPNGDSEILRGISILCPIALCSSGITPKSLYKMNSCLILLNEV